MKPKRIADDPGHFIRQIWFASSGIYSEIQQQGNKLLAALSRAIKGLERQSGKAAEPCAETPKKAPLSEGYMSRAVRRLGWASSEDLQVVIRCIELLSRTEALEASIRKQLSFETA